MTDFVSIWMSAAPAPPFEPSLTPSSPTLDEDDEPAESSAEAAGEVDEDDDEPEDEEEVVDLDALIAEAEHKALLKARAELIPEREALRAEQERTAALGMEVAALRGRILDGLSHDISNVVLGVTRRVVGDAMVHHPDALKRVIEDAVGRFPERSGLHVRVAPEDVERVRGWLGDAEVVADEAVSGGCIVDGEEGAVDASLEAVYEGLDAVVEAWRQERQ